jgi:hypothetical protein
MIYIPVWKKQPKVKLSWHPEFFEENTNKRYKFHSEWVRERALLSPVSSLWRGGEHRIPLLEPSALRAISCSARDYSREIGLSYFLSRIWLMTIPSPYFSSSQIPSSFPPMILFLLRQSFSISLA